MTNTVFGVSANFGLEFEIEEAEILKETAKQITLASRMQCFGYKKVILKTNQKIARSPEEAVSNFVESRLGKIARLKVDIREYKAEIEQAKKLLDEGAMTNIET